MSNNEVVPDETICIYYIIMSEQDLSMKITRDSVNTGMLNCILCY